MLAIWKFWGDRMGTVLGNGTVTFNGDRNIEYYQKIPADEVINQLMEENRGLREQLNEQKTTILANYKFMIYLAQKLKNEAEASEVKPPGIFNIVAPDFDMIKFP